MKREGKGGLFQALRYCQMLWMARSGGVLLDHQTVLEFLSI